MAPEKCNASWHEDPIGISPRGSDLKRKGRKITFVI